MSVFIAARTLGVESGWSLSHLEMQKVLYVAQMIHLGRTGSPLFEDRIEAWDFGPVAPALYHSLKAFGGSIVNDIPNAQAYPWTSAEAYTIADAYSFMRHMSAGELVNFTHRPGGAWERFYQSGKRNSIITVDAIMNEWNAYMRPSNEAVDWASRMANEIEASPPAYMESEGEHSFRARLFGENLH